MRSDRQPNPFLPVLDNMCPLLWEMNIQMTLPLQVWLAQTTNSPDKMILEQMQKVKGLMPR